MSSDNRIDLSGAVALVTGAAGGIGAASCQALHERGARVVLVDLQQDRVDSIACTLGADRTLALSADVTDMEAMKGVVVAANEAFGAVDVVFANAGISSGAQAHTINSAPDGVFEKVLSVNLFGVWNTIRATLEDVTGARGHILVTSSAYAYLNGMVNAPYAAAKAGVEQLGRALRTELAPYGATAGVLYPGWVHTPIIDVAFGADPLATDLVRRATPWPLRIPISPERVGRAVVRGIERRASRIQVPRRWMPLFALRGITNPISDALLERDAVMRRLVRDVDDR